MSFALRKHLRLFFSLSDWSLLSQEVCWHHSWWKGSTRIDQSALDFCLRVASLKVLTETPPPSTLQNFSVFIRFLKATLRIKLWKCSHNAITNQTEPLIAFCLWALLLFGRFCLHVNILGLPSWSWGGVQGSQVRHYLIHVWCKKKKKNYFLGIADSFLLLLLFRYCILWWNCKCIYFLW